MQSEKKEKVQAHRLLGCEWRPEVLPEANDAPEEHVLTAKDFVVDEFELYGLGD